MDTVKVRLQTAPGSRLVPVLLDIIKKEGLSALFNGLEPALIRQVFYGNFHPFHRLPVAKLTSFPSIIN